MYRRLSYNQAFFSVHRFLEAKRIEPRNNFYIQFSQTNATLGHFYSSSNCFERAELVYVEKQ